MTDPKYKTVPLKDDIKLQKMDANGKVKILTLTTGFQKKLFSNDNEVK